MQNLKRCASINKDHLVDATLCHPMPPDTIPLVPYNDDVICYRFLSHPAPKKKKKKHADYPDAS